MTSLCCSICRRFVSTLTNFVVESSGSAFTNRLLTSVLRVLGDYKNTNIHYWKFVAVKLTFIIFTEIKITQKLEYICFVFTYMYRPTRLTQKPI